MVEKRDSQTKVLAVDDRPENLFSLTRLIEPLGVEVVCAESGEKALELLLEHEFALAILDVHMPGMDGFELASLMRGARRSRHTPIMFITGAQSDQDTIFEGYEHGAVDFVLKPVNPQILKSRVNVFIDLFRKNQLLKQQLEEVERLRDEAEAANRAKSRFLATVSHEIRTPLSAILGFAELVKEGEVDIDGAMKPLDVILRNGRQLHQLIEDVLDLSRIEANRLELRLSWVPIADILRSVEDTYGLQAGLKGLDFSVIRKPGTPDRIYTDSHRLHQILVNLVGNAIKFTERGKVKVEVSPVEDRRLSGPQVRFRVSDTGPGIARESREHLFQPFSQGDVSVAKKYGGTGLGLVISKELAQALGGDVRLVETFESSGATFECTVNALPSENSVATSAASEKPGADSGAAMERRLSNLNVLIVDDFRDNRLLLKYVFEAAGARVTCAESGERALDLVETSEPDLVLMDLRMPGLDGCETTRMLRDRGFRQPVLAISAHAFEDDIERCLEAGCDDYLPRPVGSDKLVERMVALVENR